MLTGGAASAAKKEKAEAAEEWKHENGDDPSDFIGELRFSTGNPNGDQDTDYHPDPIEINKILIELMDDDNKDNHLYYQQKN